MSFGIYRDLKHALRGLLRAPGFAVVVVLTLALGIGANTAIFSIVDQLLLRPLPYPEGEQLVMLQEAGLRGTHDTSPANWLDWQRESRNIESFAAWTGRNSGTLTGQGEPEQIGAQAVSHEFFPLLRVQPMLGRVFKAQDDVPNAPRTAVISYSLWQRKFSGDQNIIGKMVEINASPREIIGVMPAGFHFLTRNTDLWVPYYLDRNQDWRQTAGRFIPYVVARLKPAATLTSASTEMETIASRLAQLHEFNRNTTVRVTSLREVITGQVRLSLWILFAAVGVLLIIACFNVANLLLARAANRRRELAIRTSLGAARSALVRQVLAESTLLAILGGAAGLLLAQWGIDVLLGLVPPNLVQASDVSIDGWILLYSFALSLVTGMLVGLAPAVGATRGSLADNLRTGGRSVTHSTRLRQGLIVAQVAMTAILLFGAGLMARSFFALSSTSTGLDASNVFTFRFGLPAVRYDAPRRVAFFGQVTEALRSLPGVQAAGAGVDLPVTGTRISGTSFHVLGQPEVAPADRPSTAVRIVTPGYFETLGIPLLRGRDFNKDDMGENAPLVFIVNEAFVREFLASQDPLASSVSVYMQSENPHAPIVGVVGDTKERSLRDEARPTVFYNHNQLSNNSMTIFVKATRRGTLPQEAVQVIRNLDKNIAVTEMAWLDDALAESLARDRLNAVVSTAFGATALLLASIGLYGLLAFTVASRTAEVGIRMALGARTSSILWMVLSQGLRLVGIGAIAGLIGAAAVSRFLESLLYGVPPHDPVTFAAVAALLMMVSIVAVIVPARRATKVDPQTALRQE